MNSLAFASLKSVSVYIHIPFCDTRCRYCNFYFETTKSQSIIDRTLDAIVVQALDMWPQIGSPRINTLYFGGGTPSKIPAVRLSSFFEELKGIFGPLHPAPHETAFEANPEHITEDYLEALASAGVNRLSIGVQSFDDEHLSLLGRGANSEIVIRALGLVQKFQKQHKNPFSLNFDLITGIPNQSPNGSRDDVQKALDFGADHLSLYALTIEPQTALAQAVERKAIVPLSPIKHEEIWEAAHRVLIDCGFKPYEVSNYAKKGFESKHNLAYWRMQPYLGLGPGAVGTLPIKSGDALVPVRITQASVFKFNPAPNSSGSCELPNAREFFIDHLLTNLRIESGIKKADILGCFGEAGIELLATLATSWAKLGLELVDDQDSLALGHASRIILDPILADSLHLFDANEELVTKLKLNWTKALDSEPTAL